MPVHHVPNWDAVDLKVVEVETLGERVVQIVETPKGVTIITSKGSPFETRKSR